ncbi:MAG: hypothetical protein IKD02_05580 [Clostridia bacterium]|nr:hypothetical protein [Clostridia bacterium]
MKKTIIKDFLIAIVLYVLFAVYGYFNLPSPYGIHSFWIAAVVVAVLGLVFWLVKRLAKK